MPEAHVEFREAEIEQSLPGRFEAQVRRHGERLAVKTRAEALSYAGLNDRANRVAHRILGERGGEPEPIALMLDQGASLISAILGALKAGKFYVPIDPSYPDARIASLLRESNAPLVLCGARHVSRARVASGVGVGVLEIDRLLPGAPAENPALAIHPDALAYLFCTSGSTGRPKGVADTHRNVLHNIRRYTNTLKIACTDRLTLLQSCGFSGSVSNVFGALLNGAAVFPFDLRAEGIDRVAAWLSDERITIYHSVPSIFRHLAAGSADFPELRIIRLEGDQASSTDVEIYRSHFPDTCTLVNGLGATECGLARQYFVDKNTAVRPGALPVGYAVPDMDVRVVGDDGRPLAAGAIGEIVVSSRYLAPGYWQDPGQTARAFSVDPARPEQRVYRTGDLGRLRADGCLEHLGRRDSRRKVKGHLIDVAEVEGALLALCDVEEAVVEVRDDERRGARIVAHVVPRRGSRPNVSDLRRDLADALPDFMLPAAFVLLESLPLTTNGKVDRAALPAPAAGRPSLRTPYREPRTDLERALAGIWAHVLDLDVDQIGIDDDFFDLGGDSLGATRVVNRLCTKTKGDLTMAIVFDSPTIASLAQRLQSEMRS